MPSVSCDAPPCSLQVFFEASTAVACEATAGSIAVGEVICGARAQAGLATTPATARARRPAVDRVSVRLAPVARRGAVARLAAIHRRARRAVGRDDPARAAVGVADDIDRAM